MARRTGFFGRLLGDYSSDSAAGVRSDGTTPRLAAEVDTPIGAVDYGIPDDRRLDFEDGYSSDASFVTVDNEFDTTANGVARDDLADAPREFPARSTANTRGIRRRHDGDDFGRGNYNAGGPDSRSIGRRSGLHRRDSRRDDRSRTPPQFRRDEEETDVKTAVPAYFGSSDARHFARQLDRYDALEDNDSVR
jgi:hypothetical protein